MEKNMKNIGVQIWGSLCVGVGSGGGGIVH